MRREHVVVGGDDREVWRRFATDQCLVIGGTAGETVGYTPRTGQAAIEIHGSAPTLAGSGTSSTPRDMVAPNAKVAMDIDSPKFFDLLMGRLSGKQ